MRGNDRIVLIAVPLLALCAAFWFLIISPKRDEAKELDTQIADVSETLHTAEAQIAVAEDARRAFPVTYGELVKLGRAVPDDDDQATLVYDMSELGKANKLNFQSFEVIPRGDPPPAPIPVEPQTAATAADQSEEQVAAAEAGTTPAATPTSATTETPAPTALEPTEAAAAMLPIGARIGPAGLPVMPYGFSYVGDFFNVSDFIGDIDAGVSTKSGEPVVHGRLMTIDGFALRRTDLALFPTVEANFAVTTYIVPPEQGLSAGATPAGPAPDASGAPSVVADTTDVATPTPTATATAP